MAERRSPQKSDPLLDREVAKCKVLEQIGQGGMGIVYKVLHRTLQKHLALKVLPIDSGITQRQLEQFFIEARAQASIDHGNVVQVYDVDRFENWFYILMQHIDGPSLADAMVTLGALPWPAAVQVAFGAARGLAAAHNATPVLVHQDVKPSNILLAPNWVAKVLDFGLVKALDETPEEQTSHVAGTAHYVPPEILLGKQPTPACDLYSLGITLFEALTNRRVWTGRTRTDVVKARLSQAPPPLAEHIPEGLPRPPRALVEIVEQLLQRDPADRPSDAHELARQLREILLTHQGPLPPVPTERVKPKKAGATNKPSLLEHRPSSRRIEQWARQSKVLYSCKKCAVFFLRTGHVDGKIVLCPACNSKLTVPDKESLKVLRSARPSSAGGRRIDRIPTPTTAEELDDDAELEEMTVEQLPEQSQRADPIDPLERLHLPPAFLGRDWLVTRINEAVLSETKVVCIEGAPGLGKTRFLQELPNHLRDSFVLLARAERRERPQAPFDELTALALRTLEAHQPDALGPLLERHGSWLLQVTGPMDDIPLLAQTKPQTQLRPERQLDAIADLFELLLRSGKAVLLIDDVDRCGERANPLWKLLLERVARYQSLLVLTHNAALPEALSGQLSELPNESFSLDPMPEGLLAPLFTSIFGLARYPESLCEAVNYVAQGVPGDLADIVRESVAAKLLVDSDKGWSWSPAYLEKLALRLPSRIDNQLAALAGAMPPMHGEVLGVLARIGCGLTAAQLVEAGGVPADKLWFILNDVLKERILLKQDDHYSFVSEGLRTMLADAVPQSKRAGLHARIARILENESDDPDPPRSDILAIHLEEAGEPLRAVHWRITAAKGFATEGQLERSRESYEAALGLLEDPASHKTSGLFPRLRRKSELPDSLEVRAALADIHCQMGQTNPAMRMLKDGLQAAHGRGDQALIGQFERGLALAGARSASSESLSHFARIENIPELVDTRLLAEIAFLYLIRDNHQKTRELLNKALTLPQLKPADRLGALLILARLELRLGHWDKVGELAEQSLSELAEGQLRQIYRPRLLVMHARALCRTGALREANSRLDAARRYQNSSLEAELEVRLTQAELLLASGLAEPAAQAARAMKRRAIEASRPYDEAWALIYQGEAEIHDPRKSNELLSLALKHFEKLKAPYGRARAYIGLAHCYVEVGNPERAKSVLDFARKNLDSAGLTWPRARLALVKSQLLQLRGDTSGAIAQLEKADKLAEKTQQWRLVKMVRSQKARLSHQSSP